MIGLINARKWTNVSIKALRQLTTADNNGSRCSNPISGVDRITGTRLFPPCPSRPKSSEIVHSLRSNFRYPFVKEHV